MGVHITCVQGGSLFPSSQGWVLSVLKKGIWLSFIFSNVSFHMSCLILGEISVG